MESELIKKYPKIVFNKIHLGKDEKNNYFGLIVDNNQILIGFYLPDSKLATTFFKISKPILVSKELKSLLKKVPIVKGLTQNEMDYLTDMIKGSSILNEDSQLEFFESLMKDSVNCKYDYIFNPDTKTCVKIHKNLKLDNKNVTELKELMKEKEAFTPKKENKENENEENKTLINELIDIKSESEFPSKLDSELKLENEKLNDILSEIKMGNGEIKEDYWQNEYLKLEKEFKDKVKATVENHNVLIQTILKKDKELNYKNQMIQKLRNYSIEWSDWFKNKESFNQKELQNTMIKIQEQEKIINNSFEKLKNCETNSKLNSEQLNELKIEIDRITQEQKILISKYINEQEETTQKLDEKEILITGLKDEIEDFKKLLNENKKQILNSKVSTPFDSTANCKTLHDKIITINNIFWRKLKMISELSKILSKVESQKKLKLPLDELSILQNDFENITKKINQIISFLDLNKYSNIKNLTLNSDICNELIDTLNYWDTNQKEFYRQELLLNDIYETVLGKVRIFVKLKNKTNMETITLNKTVDENTQIYVKCPNRKIPELFPKAEPYYQVFDDSVTNLQIFSGDAELKITTSTNNLFETVRLLSNGHSLTMFNYGVSGSGKSYLLFGNEWNKGVISYINEYIGNENGSMNLKEAWELSSSVTNLNFGKITGKIHLLINGNIIVKNFDSKYIINETSEIKQSPSIIDTINDINIYRKKMNRIKKTALNDNSSRSYLFLNFECRFKDVVSNLIIIDSPGIENPYDIFKSNLNIEKLKLADVMYSGGDRYLERYVKCAKENCDKKALGKETFNLLKESFFINESLNHIRYYFNKINGNAIRLEFNKDLENYNTEKVFVSPKNEFLGIIKPENNCLLIPILTVINKMVKYNKYVLMCSIRDEPEYCEETIFTLKFTDSLM
jgi:hypothetical protein